MSRKPPIASFSSDFQTIFYTSMKEYKKKTKEDLLEHPLFEQWTSGDDELTKLLTSTVNVLYAFSRFLGEGIGLLFPPANVIFTGIGVLLTTSNDAVSQDNLAFTVLDRIEDCLRRLESYTNKPTMESMRGIIGKIMVEVLGILAIVTKEMKKGRAKQYLAILIGRSDLEDALSRLHKLTQMTRPPTR